MKRRPLLPGRTRLESEAIKRNGPTRLTSTRIKSFELLPEERMNGWRIN